MERPAKIAYSRIALCRTIVMIMKLVIALGAIHKGLTEEIRLSQPVQDKNLFEHDVGPQNLSGSWINNTWTIAPEGRKWRGCPPEYIIAQVAGIPSGCIGLFLNFESILKPSLLKG